MRIEIGQPVYARDGKKVGSVDRVVLNPATRHVDEFVIHKGVLSADRLVDRSLVAEAGEDGVRLNVDPAAIDALPEFFVDWYVVVPPVDGKADQGLVPIAPGTLLYATPALDASVGMWLSPSFELGPPEPSSQLPPGDVQFDRGADVVDADGQSVGKVHDVYFDAAGAVTGVLVRTGHVRHRDVAVPTEWIAGFDDDRVRLSVSAAEAIDRGALTR